MNRLTKLIKVTLATYAKALAAGTLCIAAFAADAKPVPVGGADLVIHEGGNVTYGGGDASTYSGNIYYAINKPGEFGETVSAIRTEGSVTNAGSSIATTGVCGIDNGAATLTISSIPGGIAITNDGWIGAINQQSTTSTSGTSDLDVQGVGDITVKATGNYVSGGKTLYYAAKGIGIYMAKNTDIAQNKVTVGAKSLTVEAEGTAYAIQGCLGGRTVRIDIEGDVNIRGVGANSQAYGSNFTSASPVGHMDLNFGSLTVSSEGANSTYGLHCAGGATANVVLDGNLSVSAPNATATGFRLAGNSDWSLKGKDGKAIDIILSGAKGLGGQFGSGTSTAKLSLDVNTFAVTGTTTTAHGLYMSAGTPSVTGSIRSFTVSAKGDATAIDAPYGNVGLAVGALSAVSTEGAAKAILANGGQVSIGGIAGQPVSIVGDVEVVASGSTLTFTNAVDLVGNVTNAGTIAIGSASARPFLAVTGAFRNAGTVTVDMTGATAMKYTLIAATEASDFGTCQFAVGKDNGYLLCVEGNDLIAAVPVEVTPTAVAGTTFTVKTNGVEVAKDGENRYMVIADASVDVIYAVTDDTYAFADGKTTFTSTFKADGTAGTPAAVLPAAPTQVWFDEAEGRYDVSYTTNELGVATFVVTHPDQLLPISYSTNGWGLFEAVSVRVKHKAPSGETETIVSAASSGYTNWMFAASDFGGHAFEMRPGFNMPGPSLSEKMQSMKANILYTTNFNLKVTQPTEGGTLAAYTNGVSAATAAGDDSWPLALVDEVSLVATPADWTWAVEWVKTNGVEAAAVDGATALPVTNVFMMATNAIAVTGSFVVSAAYRADASNTIETAYVAATNDIANLPRLTEGEREAALDAADAARTNGWAAVGDPLARTPTAVDMAATAATNGVTAVRDVAEALSDSKPWNLVIASDGIDLPFPYSQWKRFPSFAEAFTNETHVPFVTNVHVVGFQTIATNVPFVSDWNLDVVAFESAPGVTNVASLSIATVDKGAGFSQELVSITNRLAQIFGDGLIVLSVTNGTPGAAAYKADLESRIVPDAEAVVRYANFEPERKQETNPDGKDVTSEDINVTDQSKVEADGTIVLPGVETDGKITVDVQEGVSNDVVVAGKLKSSDWDVVIVNATTNTLTVGAIETGMNVLITNVTDVGRIVTLEQVIAGKNVQIENNGHLEANVEASQNITIANSSLHTIVGTYKAGGDINISGEYGSLSNVVIDAVGTLAVSGTNVISGPVDFKSDTVIAYAIGARTEWSVEGDNHTLSIDFEDVAKSTKFGIRIDAAQATGDTCGTYVLATNALVASGFRAEVVGPDGTVLTTLSAGDDPVYVGAKAFALSVNAADELVFEVSFGQFTVTYDAQDGKWPNGQTVSNIATLVSDGYVLPAEDPVRAKYVFKGWYASWTNGAAKVENGTVLAQRVDHTIYAKWESGAMPEGGGEDVFSGQDIDGAATMVLGAQKDGEGNVSQPVANGDLAIPERIGNGTDGKFVAAIAAEAYAKPNYDDKVADDKKLTSVSLPGYLTRVGDAAFYACTNLTNVAFAVAKDYKTNAKTTLEIGSRAFANTAVETLVFPAGMKTKLAAGAFAYCPNLKEIFIYGDVECMAKGPFAGAGDGSTPITIHLSPTYAADTNFVAMLTASMNTSKVTIDSEPLGQVAIEDFNVTDTLVEVTFRASITSPWGVVSKNTVTLFYTDDLEKGFAGTGNYKLPLDIGPADHDGCYWAKFDKPSSVGDGPQFYRLTVGAER